MILSLIDVNFFFLHNKLQLTDPVPLGRHAVDARAERGKDRWFDIFTAGIPPPIFGGS